MTLILDPVVLECACGSVLKIASAWSAFRCGKCGVVVVVDEGETSKVSA